MPVLEFSKVKTDRVESDNSRTFQPVGKVTDDQSRNGTRYHGIARRES